MPTQMPRSAGTENERTHKSQQPISHHATHEFNRGSHCYDAQRPQPKLLRQIQIVLSGVQLASDGSEKTSHEFVPKYLRDEVYREALKGRVICCKHEMHCRLAKVAKITPQHFLIFVIYRL